MTRAIIFNTRSRFVNSKGRKKTRELSGLMMIPARLSLIAEPFPVPRPNKPHPFGLIKPAFRRWGQSRLLTTHVWTLRSPRMARKLRIQYPGAIYHVMNRGDRGELIFLDEVDHERFLETLQEACAKTGWQVQAYCLIPNHFHLVLETPQPNLATGMKWFLGTYSSRFSGRHNYFGHLFGGRYKALVVDGSTPGYLKTVCDYVHLNPVRARLLRSGEALRDYCWSSFPHYLKSPGRRPGWLRVGRLLGEHGIPKDSPVGR